MSTVTKIKEFVSGKSRIKKLDHFYSLCSPQSSILDVGVSNNEYNTSINLFLNNFRLCDHQYTGLAIQQMAGIKKKHPNKKFIEYTGGVFPFRNKKFDWVHSNAVIEHVGSQKDQLLFINEMLRVGKNVFFTTPNKWFPVESHTNTFFRHWFNEYFYGWCKRNEPFWSMDNLLLLGLSDIRSLMEQSCAKHYEINSNRFLGWPMTFTIVCSS